MHQKIPAANEPHSAPRPDDQPYDSAQRPMIHRVCITCNNMFATDLEHFDAKHCPACRRA